MVGKVRVRGQGKVMKGRKQTTTTYKHGGKVKKRVRKQVGGVMPGVGAAGMARPLAAGAAGPLAAGVAGPLAAGVAGPLAAGVARPMGGGVLPGARTMVKKGGSVKGAGRRRSGTAPSRPKKKPGHFVQGSPNTPGELRREIKGGMTMGRIRTKKMLKGDYDVGKKLRKQRKHHS